MAIFFILLLSLFFLAAAFVGIAWAGQPKKHWKIPAFLMVSLFIFSGVLYFFLGKGVHVIYQGDDRALRQVADLLDTTMPLSMELQHAIKSELLRQTARPGAEPTIWLLEGQRALLENNYQDAQRAYQQAYEYNPGNIETAVLVAQTGYLAENPYVSPALNEFLLDLQEKHPEEPGLLNLLAVIAYNKEDYQRAIYYWQQLLPQYAASSQEAQTLQLAINNAVERDQVSTFDINK